MVIGVEIGRTDFRDNPILGKKSKSFRQWKLMCKPHLIGMMERTLGAVGLFL